MGVAGREQITKLIQTYNCIHPFDYALLDGDGYVLTVHDETTLHYLEHRNVISYEVVFTPPNYVSHLTAKSKYGRMGLSFLNVGKGSQRIRGAPGTRARQLKQRPTAYHDQTGRPVDAYRVYLPRGRTLSLPRRLHVPVHERR